MKYLPVVVEHGAVPSGEVAVVALVQLLIVVDDVDVVDEGAVLPGGDSADVAGVAALVTLPVIPHSVVRGPPLRDGDGEGALVALPHFGLSPHFILGWQRV